MNRILSQLDAINELLVESPQSKSGVGLLNGKLGASIYLFTLQFIRTTAVLISK